MEIINQKRITYVMSDLHIAEGNLGQGQNLGTENFFADLEFSDCIEFLICENEINTNAQLILNGDFVDFIRMTQYPISAKDFENWQHELQLAGSAIPVGKENVNEREREYGLRTNDYKCVWKLYLAIKGHPQVFNALAKWVASGHRLKVIIGNHDPEWYWELLQNYLRNKLFDLASQLELKYPIDTEQFKNSVSFNIDGYSPEKTIWIEHGHRFERMTKTCDKHELNLCIGERNKNVNKAIPQHEKELFLPIGSFFNRYLVNKVEMIFPYVDNLTSGKALFQSLFDEDFRSAGRILWHYGSYTVKVVLKHFWRSLGEFLLYLLVTVVPLGAALYLSYQLFSSDTTFLFGLPSWASTILKPIMGLAPLLLRYMFKYILYLFHVTNRPLKDEAFASFKKGGAFENYDTVFLGHNHTPELVEENGKTYINTGTWTDKYIFKYKEIQSGNKYVVGKITKDESSAPMVELLQWRTDKLALQTFTSFKIA